MKVVLSEEFLRAQRRIKDESTRKRIISQILKLESNPFSGKPLKYGLKNHRSIRIGKFRVIYRIEDNTIIINSFGHRKDVY